MSDIELAYSLLWLYIQKLKIFLKIILTDILGQFFMIQIIASAIWNKSTVFNELLTYLVQNVKRPTNNLHKCKF